MLYAWLKINQVPHYYYLKVDCVGELLLQSTAIVSAIISILFYFSIDATTDDGRLGRYINHSKSAQNLLPKLIEAPDGQPHIIFLAARNISAEQEVLYDYGERNPQILQSHPWLRK